MQRIRIVAFAGLIAACGAAAAADSGLYLAIDGGQATASGTCGPVTGATCNSTSTAVRGTAGYRFNRYIGTEFSYSDFGTASLTAPATDIRHPLYGIDGAVVGWLPLPYRLSAMLQVGYAETHVRTEGYVNGLAFTPVQTWSDGAFVGAGLQFDVVGGLAVRVLYDYYGRVGNDTTVGKTPLWAVTGGVSYTF